MDACAVAVAALFLLTVPFFILAGWLVPLWGGFDDLSERFARVPVALVLVALGLYVLAAVLTVSFAC